MSSFPPNRKGTTIPVKVIVKDKQWETRQVNAYCPKCFSAVGLPNDTLSSRTIREGNTILCGGRVNCV